MHSNIIRFIRNLYNGKDIVPLHSPVFIGNEKKYLNECIDSTFVSSVGNFVNKFEEMITQITGSTYAIATVNGTAALHMALILADVLQDDEVITQSLTFVATTNAIKYQKAHPVFIDCSPQTLGLCPNVLNEFLKQNTYQNTKNQCVNKSTNRVIKACLPMHTLGHSADIFQILEICKQYNILVIEDAAEALGSFINNQHLGTISDVGILSFNGNKIATSGGGGAIITNNPVLAKKAKHLTTTAKLNHDWEYEHDAIGYNYRLPNLNAALAVAQLEQLTLFLDNKRKIAYQYKTFFENNNDIHFWEGKYFETSNHWLNAIILSNKTEKDNFLTETNQTGIITRSLWKPMHHLPIYQHCEKTDMTNTENIYNTFVNIPSGVALD